jgi:hypothetical protein
MAHSVRLFDIRMADGSRHFAEIPMRIPPSMLRRRLDAAAGVRATQFLAAGLEAWIDFDFHCDSFAMHNPCGDYWLFVENPPVPTTS